MARALSSVPDLGAPTEIFLPLRSASVLVALPGVGQRIAERESDLATTGLQQVQVLDRRLGRLRRRLDAGHFLADDVGERDAERIVDAARSAGQHIDELV